MTHILLKKPHEYHKDTGVPLEVIKDNLTYLTVKSGITFKEFEILCDEIDKFITISESNPDFLIWRETTNTQSYYKGKDSLYKFAEEWGLNSYEFDQIKRIVRCRFKGNFKQDLEKTKDLIDIYIKEQGSNYGNKE
jgi:hypothetical protein